jgi:arsenite methyltransferase
MDTKTAVREKYGNAATGVLKNSVAACCSSALNCCDPITKDLYGDSETGGLPEKAVLTSLGCGNPLHKKNNVLKVHRRPK